MLNSIYKAASNLKDERASQSEYRNILRESTSHEAWNISNTKLQVLADHTYNWEDYQVIIKHLWAMLNSRPKEWRRIAKTVHVIDYLVKNGAPRAIQDIKDDLYKIRQFENFVYKEKNGVEQGVELRDKVKQLVELVNEPGKLQYEREFAKSTREKFQGISSSGHDGIGNVVPTDKPQKKSKFSAAPASGNQYGGFGSEDIAKFGYNDKDKYGDSGAYDPYTNTQSIDTAKEEEKPKKSEEVKHEPTKHTLDDDSESSFSSVDSIDSDNTKKKKKKQKKRRAKQAREKDQKEANVKAGIPEPQAKNGGLFNVPKANRTLPGALVQKAPAPLVAQPVVQQQPAPVQNNGEASLMDLLGSSQPTQQQPVAQNQNAFGFMQQNAPQQQAAPAQQQNNMFGGMSMASNTTQQQQPQQNSFGFVQQAAPQQPVQQQQPTQNAFDFMSTPTQSAPVQQQQVQQTTDMFGGMSMGSNAPQTFNPVQQTMIQPIGAPTQEPEKKNVVKSGGLWDDKSSNLFDLSSGGLKVAAKEEPKQQPNLLLTTQSNSTEQMFMNNNQPTGQLQNNQGGFQTGINPNQLLGQMNMQNNQQQQQQMMQMQQQRMMMMQQQQQQQMMMNNNMNPLAMNNNPLGMQQQQPNNFNMGGQMNMQQMNPMQQQMMMQQRQQQQQQQNQSQFNQYNTDQFGQFK